MEIPICYYSDMANIEITWEIDGGQISAEESVRGMLGVIQEKTIEHTGTFWTWENVVSFEGVGFVACLLDCIC